MKILIIEDQFLMLDTIEETVKDVYPEAEIFKSSQIVDSTEIIDHNDIDLIISDLDFDGDKRFEMVQIANEHKIPCIVYSAHCNESFVEKAKDLNAKAYVCKLGDVSEFKEAITHYQTEGWRTCSVVKSKLASEINSSLHKPDLEGVEEKIIHYLLMGNDRKDIAKKLHIKEVTLYNYISKMKSRNNCSIEQLIHRYITWKSVR